MRLLVWVSKSHAKLAAALRSMGHQVSASRIPQLLERLNYRRQVNRKTKEGSHHPDRDAQFEHINKQVMAFQAAGQPVISVDTKKKELVGDYKNSGSDQRGASAVDEQGAKIAISTLTDAQQPRSATTRSLFRDKPDPCRKLSPILEAFSITRGCDKCGCRDRSNSFDLAEALTCLAHSI